MSDDLSDLVRQMLDGMHTLSKTDTILGEPIQAKNATLIPVHRLRITRRVTRFAPVPTSPRRCGTASSR